MRSSPPRSVRGGALKVGDRGRGAGKWCRWIDAIGPRLIPADDIDRVAADIIASYSDPELEAFARHERAWYRSDGAEQAYWYRVRKAVRRRLEGR